MKMSLIRLPKLSNNSSCEIALKKTLPHLDGSKLDMLDCWKERQETNKIKGEITQ